MEMRCGDCILQIAGGIRGEKGGRCPIWQSFLREMIGLCRQLTGKLLLIRLDSGNDASGNIGIFMEESYKYNNVFFIIKRNPRKEGRGESLGMLSFFYFLENF